MSGSLPSVGIFGAGAIGAFVGALLSSAGAPVVLVGRGRLLEEHAAGRVVAIGAGAREARLAADAIVTDDPAALADVDVCLVSVKSGATAEAARTLRSTLRRGDTRVISVQNGLRNRAILADALGQPVSAGVVGFNVAPDGAGRFPQTVAGALWLEAGDPRVAAIAAALRRSGQRVRERAEIDAVIRGKLLVNAINGVGGATGMATRSLLADVDARRCYARSIREGLAAFAAGDEAVARVGGLGPRGLAWLLGLPDWIFRPLLARSSADPEAVTSTVQDLRRRRPTEIDALNGEIVALGEARGVATPMNRAIVAAVRAHEAAARAGADPEFLTPAALLGRGLDPSTSSTSTSTTSTSTAARSPATSPAAHRSPPWR
ncbi:MAG: 2-dehydropantoate 2-reductase [Nannocystaceae bacterium]